MSKLRFSNDGSYAYYCWLQAEENRRNSGSGIASDGSSAANFGVGSTAVMNTKSSSTNRRREASVVLVDRTLDVAAAASRGGSLLQRILSSLPRAGSSISGSDSDGIAAYNPASEMSGGAHLQHWSPTASAHQHEVGVILPALTPGLGVPSASASTECETSSELMEDGDGRQGAGGAAPRLGAMKALAGCSWPAPPSMCHPSSAVGGAGRLVFLMACLGEEEGQAELVAALERFDRGKKKLIVLWFF